MFIQEKQHCPKCGKFIMNHLDRHLCGRNAPLSTELAVVMILPQGLFSQPSKPAQEKEAIL